MLHKKFKIFLIGFFLFSANIASIHLVAAESEEEEDVTLVAFIKKADACLMTSKGYRHMLNESYSKCASAFAKALAVDPDNIVAVEGESDLEIIRGEATGNSSLMKLQQADVVTRGKSTEGQPKRFLNKKPKASAMELRILALRLCYSAYQQLSTGDTQGAQKGFSRALELDPYCHSAKVGIYDVRTFEERINSWKLDVKHN